MRRLGRVSVLIGIVVAGILALSSTASAQPPAGFIKDGTFTSDRLGFSLPVPPEFKVISAAEMEILTEAGADLLKKGNNSQSKIDDAVGRSIRLIAIGEKPIGYPQNSVIEFVAVKQKPGVTANMSMAANMMVLKGSPYVLKRSLGSVKIGKNIFRAAEFDASVNETKFMHRMYVLIHRGYSIVCGITYFTDSQRLDLEKILASLSLK